MGVGERIRLSVVVVGVVLWWTVLAACGVLGSVPCDILKLWERNEINRNSERERVRTSLAQRRGKELDCWRQMKAVVL